MFDNLGFGEIAMLALMALLFFGPERLPQIGARIGRWIATLTQSSKAFMNEWREEALVVYDAVEEVRGIRDEIAAARAEIAGTVTTARDDVNGALSGARADVQSQVREATTFSPTSDTSTEGTIPSPSDWAEQRHQLASPPTGGIAPAPRSESERAEGRKTPPSTTPDRAIERTNAILAGLRKKRGEAETTATPSEPPPSITFSDDNPLNQSAQRLWHQAAPGARKAPRSKTQPAAAPIPALISLCEAVAALESDVQALRDELARTRAELEAKTVSPGVETEPPAEPEPDPAPRPRPVHTAVQAGEPL